jgi:heme/copper-type cytochrome/quinol oxidase subunit 2
VDVRTPDDFKKWVGEQKAAVKQAALPTPAGAPASAPAAPPPTAQALPN